MISKRQVVQDSGPLGLHALDDIHIGQPVLRADSNCLRRWSAVDGRTMSDCDYSDDEDHIVNRVHNAIDPYARR